MQGLQWLKNCLKSESGNDVGGCLQLVPGAII